MRWEKQWFQFFILIFLAFIWGSSFILIKVGLKSFTNVQAASIRLVLASFVLWPIAFKHLKLINRKNIKSILIVAFVGSFIPAFLFTKAQTQIDSALAGMLNSLTPVWTLLVGYFFHKSRFRLMQIAGLILGLLGAVGLILIGNDSLSISLNAYALFVVLATLMYGTSVNEVKAHLTHLSGLQITSLTFFFVGPVALIYLLTTDLSGVTANANWHWHLGALAVLGIVGTSFAMLLMNSLIRYTTPVLVSTVTYIIPIFAIGWGVLDGETISFYHILCMAIILTGIWLINKKQKK